MQLNVEEVLANLNEQNESFTNSRNEIQGLFEQQSTYIESLIEQYKPILDWYKDKTVRFSHPNLDVTSGAGPILGADKNIDYVIVYNIEKECLEKVSLRNNDRDSYFTYNLVREGHFKNAVAGIKYLTTMLEKYNTEFQELAMKLRNEIESV